MLEAEEDAAEAEEEEEEEEEEEDEKDAEEESERVTAVATGTQRCSTVLSTSATIYAGCVVVVECGASAPSASSAPNVARVYKPVNCRSNPLFSPLAALSAAVSVWVITPTLKLYAREKEAAEKNEISETDRCEHIMSAHTHTNTFWTGQTW